MILCDDWAIYSQFLIFFFWFCVVAVPVFGIWYFIHEFFNKFDDETRTWAENNDLYKLPREERIRRMKIFQEYNRKRKDEEIKEMEDYINFDD